MAAQSHGVLVCFHSFTTLMSSNTYTISSYTVYPTSWTTWWSSASQKAHSYVPISEVDICRALDQFAGVEMRLGK